MPLFWLSLCFITGIVLADWTGVPVAGWLGSAAASLLLWPLLARLPWNAAATFGRVDRRLKIPPVLLITALALGGLRCQSAHAPITAADLAFYNHRGPAQVTAWVSEPPDERDQVTMLRLQAEWVTLEGQAGAVRVRGGLAVTLRTGSGVQYGDRLSLSGKLADPPKGTDFSYREYLARQGIFSLLNYPQVQRLESGAGSRLLTILYGLRERARQVIEAIYPPPEGQLLEGILLGLDRGLPAEIEDAFRRTGTSHIIAISGANLVVLAGFFASLFQRVLSRWWATLAALIAITAYTLLVGAGPSVVRAALMSGLSLIAVQIGRPGGGVNALFFSAGLMCLANPNLPWDVSFQLSVAATLGLVVYASRLSGGLLRIAGKHLPGRVARLLTGLLGEYLLFTLVAQAFTLPVITYHFGRISLVAPLANLLILPAQPPLMILAGLAVMAGTIWLPLGSLTAWPGWALSAYTLRVVGLLGGVPGAEWVVGTGAGVWVIFSYTLLLGLAFAWDWLKAHINRVRPALLLFLIAGLAAFLWRQALAGPDGRLHLLVYNLEGAPAVFVRSPTGQAVLLDGTTSTSQLSAALGRWLPPAGRRLDAVLVDHTQASALTGLTGALARFPTGSAYLGVDLPLNNAATGLRDLLAEQRASVMRLEGAEVLALGNDARLRVLACEDSGCAYRLEMGLFSALFPGGNSPGSLPHEMTEGLSVVVLSPVDVQAAPLEDWQALGAQYVLSTAQITSGGFVHVQSDGKRMWVEQGR
jgi:competence protein ComEC